MKINYIEAQNFRSYKHFKLSLNNKGITLIKGQASNIDEQRSNGSGKAQPYSEPVMTPRGIRSMGDLKVGDYVYNRFGKPVKVTNIFEKGKLDVYEVVLRDGRKIRVNDEHLFSYFTHSYGKNKPRWKLTTASLKDIIKDGYKKENNSHKGSYIYKYSIPLPSAIEYPKKSLAYDPYTLGAFLGDGNLNRGIAYLIVGDHKVPILNKIVGNNDNVKKYHITFEYNYKYEFVLNKPRISKHGKTVTVAHPSDFGLPSCAIQLTNDKRIPDDIFEASIEQRLQLLQGLFDTDGYVNLRSNRSNTANVSISSVNLAMVKQIQKLLWSLGYGAIIQSNDRRGKSHKSSKYVYKSIEYKVEVIGDLASIQKLFSLPYHLDKLRQAHERRKHTDRLPITNIEKLDYQEQMRCILVDDPEHLYVSGDYFVSHNSSMVYALLYALYGETPDGAKGDEVINNKIGKECFTRVEFSHFNHTYEITRYRKDKDYKNKTIVKRDSKDITLSTNKETDKEIISILGFGFDTMLNSMIFSPEKLNTFVSATDKQRKAMLEELTNTNIYKQAQALVKIDRDTDAQSLQESLNKQQQVNTLLDSQRALKAQYEQNKASHDRQIEALQNQITSLGEVDNTRLDQLKADYQRAQNDLNVTQKSLQALTLDMNVDTSKSSALQQKLSQLTYEQNNLKQQVADLLNKAKKLATSKDAVCSWCGSVLDKEHKQLEMSNIKKQATTLAQQYASYDEPINATKNELAKAQQEEDRAKQQAKDKQQLYQDESEKRNQLSIYVNQLKNDLNNIQAKSVQVQKAKAQLAQLQAQKIEEPNLTISKLELEAGQLGEKIKKLQKKQDEYKDLIQIYSDKGVKAQALSAVIPFLNQELKSILKVLTNDTMGASLSNHTKTKSGKVNNQISLQIDSAISGSNYQDLSSGEKRRIGIALNIAFMSYLKSQIGGLNLAVFDEVFDNLDTEGIDQVIQVLNNLKKEIPNILIISHNNDLNFNDQIDSKLLVKKVDNFSKIIDN